MISEGRGQVWKEEIRKRIENSTFTDDDIVSLMCWCSCPCPARRWIACSSTRCDRYLSRDAGGLSDADRGMHVAADARAHRRGGDAQAREVKPARHRRISGAGRRRCCCWRCWRWPSAAWPTVQRGVLNLRRISVLRRWSVRRARSGL